MNLLIRGLCAEPIFRRSATCACLGLLIFLVAGEISPISLQADDSSPDSGVVVNTVDGKELKPSAVKFSTGTRRLAWLADPKGTTEESRKGPLAFEVRDVQSSSFIKGVITLVEFSHVESVKYDYEKQTVKVDVKGIKEPLAGSFQYKGMNVLNFSGSVDGKTTAFGGGVLGKTVAVKSLTFSGARPVPDVKPTGTTWAIQVIHPKEKDPTLTVRNLKVLYQFSGGIEKLEGMIPVRKEAALALNGGLKRLEILATDTNTNMAAAEVETANGPAKVVIFPLTQDVDKKTGTLVGFIGEVDAGWKLFPLHTIKVITLTDVKKKVE